MMMICCILFSLILFFLIISFSCHDLDSTGSTKRPLRPSFSSSSDVDTVNSSQHIAAAEGQEPPPTYEEDSKSRRRAVLVEYEGTKRVFDFAITSLENLRKLIRENLRLDPSLHFTMTYYHPDFEEYVELETIEKLPDKPKLRILAKPSHWWDFSPLIEGKEGEEQGEQEQEQQQQQEEIASEAEQGERRSIKEANHDGGASHKQWRLMNRSNSNSSLNHMNHNNTTNLNNYWILTVKEGDMTNESGVMEKFEFLGCDLMINQEKVTKIYALYNPKLLAAFEAARLMLTNQLQHASSLSSSSSSSSTFGEKKPDWLDNPADADQRMLFLENFRVYQEQYEWNNPFFSSNGAKGEATVIPLLYHCPDEPTAWLIAERGFISVLGKDNQGLYGNGISLTSDQFYASKLRAIQQGGKGHTAAAADDDDDGEGEEKGGVYLLCMVIPGNSYPITDRPNSAKSLKGQGCKQGYHSHLTYVIKPTFIKSRRGENHHEEGEEGETEENGKENEEKEEEEDDDEKDKEKRFAEGEEEVGFPVRRKTWDREDVADELVVFNETQILPFFLFYTS